MFSQEQWDHLLPTEEDEYAHLCKNTAARRLAIILFKSGVLSEHEYMEFVYPSHELIEEALSLYD